MVRREILRQPLVWGLMKHTRAFFSGSSFFWLNSLAPERSTTMDTSYDYDDRLSPEEEAREDEFGAQFGDPRKCPRHPGEVTSSPDGLFDAPCGLCEAKGEDAARNWEYDPENTRRVHCALPTVWTTTPWLTAATCLDVPADDEIPF